MTGGSIPDERANGANGRQTVSSTDLFRGGREIVIRHAGEEYHLRITRTGKLILTK